MAGMIRPGLGRNIVHPPAGAHRTDANKLAAFNEYLDAIPYCKFESIPQEVTRYIESLNLTNFLSFGI